ncbi:MAG: hypothetical protein HY717_07350 [Planctomycetes bacterium]|nr:hypothetical protein [Planctomycetota bacterium]
MKPLPQTILFAAMLACAPVAAAPVVAGYGTRLAIDGPIAPGSSRTVTGRGAPAGDGIWVELWKIPAGGGGHLPLGSVPASNGSFRFDNIPVAEGDALHATLSRSWQFSGAGDAEGWGAAHDARLTVMAGALRVELQNLDGDAYTDAYFQNSFRYNPRYYQVIEVRIKNPAPPSPSSLLGIFWGAPPDAPGGATICEHNARIPSSMAGYETILIPMNVAETRIVPAPVASGLDGLWAAAPINAFLRLDPLNNLPANDRSRDGAVIEIDWIRIREDYRRDFHASGDLEGLDSFVDASGVQVAGGFLRYAGGGDPRLLSSLETGPIESGHFTRLALGLEGSTIAIQPNQVALLFDDRDSLGYRDGGGAGALQRAALSTDLDGRRDPVAALGPASAGEWNADGAVRTAGLRLDIPESATAGDQVRVDYIALIPETPYGPSPAVSASPTPFSTVAFWDFAEGLQGWQPNFATSNAAITADGLEFDSTGADPWVTSPPFNPPDGLALRITFHMRSNADGNGQLFYGLSFAEERSARFPVKADGSWADYSLTIPAQPAGIRLRLDPAAAPGHIALAWLRVESVEPIQAPSLRPPSRPVQGAPAPLRLSSGPLELVHYGERWGGFALNVSGVEVSSSHDASLLGYYEAAGPVWKEIGGLPVKVNFATGVLSEEVSFSDRDGAAWTLRRRFEAGKIDGSIAVETSVACDRGRNLLHVPWITLFPGLETFGATKHQGLFAGLEYLADEPSSSQADVTMPEHVRIVPDPSKITFPLMAIEHSGRYIGLVWELSPLAAAVFDSPDRNHGSGAHLLGLWAPNVGSLRSENSLFAQAPFPIDPGSPLVCRAALLGGEGPSVAPAVRQYVALRGLPPVPSFAGGLPRAVDLLAAGWLDSDAYAGDGLWRHAVWPGFNPQKASDAIVFMAWLANRTGNAALAARLRSELAAALAKRQADDPTFQSGVAHINWPTNALLLGNVPGYVAARRDGASGQTGLFDAQGIRHYPQGGSKPELGATHFTDHANGYGGSVLHLILEAAALSGNASLVSKALALLDQQTALYRNSEPRGAQTWEVPLHTPDILASAYMLKCYVLGYELTGKESYLEEARYWAWTGVPFVYLEPWINGAVSRYATIPVYGATNFVAPVWIGLPVQWCGLVYRSWLHRLASHDPEGPWETLARGITVCGLQMTWPESDAARLGLLPDVFDLRAQSRGGPAINPGTVQGSLGEAFGAGSLYGFRRARELGWLIHAPGAVEGFEETPAQVRFAVGGWGPEKYRLLLSRVVSQPVEILWRPAGTGEPFAAAIFTYDRANRWLVIEAKGDAEFLIATEKLGPGFIRGDANANGEVDIADAVFILKHLFIGDSVPPCARAVDVTGNAAVDIGDAIYLLRYLFLRGTPLPPPYPACGGEGAKSALPCASFPPCGS